MQKKCEKKIPATTFQDPKMGASNDWSSGEEQTIN